MSKLKNLILFLCFRWKFILITTAIFLEIGCDENQQSLERRCMPVLQKILDIQQEREIIRKNFSIFAEDYQRNHGNEDRFLRKKQQWLKKENDLATEVNKLYAYSYKTKCLK